MSVAIVAQGLSKRYHVGALKHESALRNALQRLARRADPAESDEFWALRDVSFEVRRGEVVGIIGRNGAGKSTLLKVLSRITHPTRGAVRVDGRVASLLEVGTGFHPELTGRENVYLNGSILGMKKREVDRKMEPIIDFAGFPRFMDTPIKRYSSGMKLRLGFAVAAHLDPEILIVDEVLAVGDVAFQKKCLGTMSRLQSGGRTVLFVSHNMQAIQSLCSRVVWIDGGQIRMDGTTDEVLQAYMDSFSADTHEGGDLTTLEQREGNGDVRYTAIELRTRDGQPVSAIRCGDDLTVRLHYHAKKPILQPHFGLRLSTELGTLLTDLSTWSSGVEIVELPPGAGSVEFEMDALNVMPGSYYLSLWLRSVGPIHYDVLDNFMTLEVMPSDYLRGMNQTFGLMYFTGRWKVPE